MFLQNKSRIRWVLGFILSCFSCFAQSTNFSIGNCRVSLYHPTNVGMTKIAMGSEVRSNLTATFHALDDSLTGIKISFLTSTNTNMIYRIQYKDSVVQTNWKSLPNVFQGNGLTQSVYQILNYDSRFYRMVIYTNIVPYVISNLVSITSIVSNRLCIAYETNCNPTGLFALWYTDEGGNSGGASFPKWKFIITFPSQTNKVYYIEQNESNLEQDFIFRTLYPNLLLKWNRFSPYTNGTGNPIIYTNGSVSLVNYFRVRYK